MKKLTQAEARKIVPRLDWHDAPGKLTLEKCARAYVRLGKNISMTVYVQWDTVDKLLRKPKPKPKVPDWEITRANCS